MNAAEIHYKVAWRARSSYPGHHPSLQKGGGLQFSNHVPLIDAPDPRRFDVRASLRDPFEQIWVRVYQQSSAIPVYVIADLSASMNFTGARAKIETLAELVSALSYSAYRTGDRFGFIGCSDGASPEKVLPSTMSRASGLEIAEWIRNRQLKGKNSEGLLSAADLLGGRRALVFLISDFHFPENLLDRILGSLSLHDVIPVMLWDHQEYEALPRFGLARVRDPETDRDRLLLLRPGLNKRIQQNFADRFAQLSERFREFGRRPLLLTNGFNPDEVTHYFFD
jgi:uncharacterized protein (DUF58 family)